LGVLTILNIDFIAIPIIFYIVVAVAQVNFTVLRQAGWLFDMSNVAGGSWYEFYTYYGEGFIISTTAGIDARRIGKILEKSKWGLFGLRSQLNLRCELCRC